MRAASEPADEALGVCKVLVTGGSGYLGQFLVSALLACGTNVVSTYSKTPINKPDTCRFRQLRLELSADKVHRRLSPFPHHLALTT